MWMTKCDSNNRVLRLTCIPNMTLPERRLKSVHKRTTHPKAKHTKEINTLSTKINLKRSILLKFKLIGTPNRFSIKIGNFYMWTIIKLPTPPGPLVDLPNKMVAITFHMTMMVAVQFSMIKMAADTMITIAAMSFNFNMIAKGH
jgi:hypothetical protein